MNTEIPSDDAVLIEFDRLSKGVDRILERWIGDDRPTKLMLLNDLANAVSPGSDWGALKAKRSNFQRPVANFDAKLIPSVDRNAEQFSARLTEMRYDRECVELTWFIEEIRPLFGLLYSGDPIIGLELGVVDGNGYTEASIHTKLLLNRRGTIHVVEVYATDVEPLVAQLIYNAIQNLNSVDLYSTLGQADCHSLRILVGPFNCALSIPELYGRVSSESPTSQGLRVLIDEGETPSATDLDQALRLASAAIPLLGLKQFEGLDNIRFKLSQPLTQVWKPIEFSAPDLLDERAMFWIPDGKYWTHQDDYLMHHNIWNRTTLGEPLDLALALIDIDDPDVYLDVSLTPMPRTTRESGELKENWRGGFHTDFKVLRIRKGEPVQELHLSDNVRERFERGFIGWAIHEGHEVVSDRSNVKTRALIRRDTRRASQHLRQVEEIMNGADPRDKKFLDSIRYG